MRPKRLLIYLAAALLVAIPVVVLLPNALGNFGEQGTMYFLIGLAVAAVAVAFAARWAARRWDPDAG